MTSHAHERRPRRCRYRASFTMTGERSLHLVVVSGFPAAGKSTTARRLGAVLDAPLLGRGDLRRRVLEPISAAVPAIARQIPAVTDRLVAAAVETTVAASPVVLDGNLHNDRQRRALRDLVVRLRLECAEVCLWGDPATLIRRFERRSDPLLTDALRRYVDGVYARSRKPAHGGERIRQPIDRPVSHR